MVNNHYKIRNVSQQIDILRQAILYDPKRIETELMGLEIYIEFLKQHVK